MKIHDVNSLEEEPGVADPCVSSSGFDSEKANDSSQETEVLDMEEDEIEESLMVWDSGALVQNGFADCCSTGSRFNTIFTKYEIFTIRVFFSEILNFWI